MKKKLVIIGTGGYAETFKDVAEQMEWKVIHLDDSSKEWEFAAFSNYINEETEFIPALEDNELRLSWCDRITQTGGQLATIIHTSAYVSPKATVDAGTVVLPVAIVDTDSVVKRGCILNLGAIVDYGCVIEEGVHLGLGAIVESENHLPRCTTIESGQVVKRKDYAF